MFGRRKRHPVIDEARQRGIPVVSVDDPEELAIAYAVQTYEEGDAVVAEQMFAEIVAYGGKTAGRAALHLGQVRHDRGDFRGTVEAYNLAVSDSDPDIKAIGSLNLGVVVASTPDNHEVAIRALTAAMESGHPEAAPKGAFNLGGLLASLGRYEEATVALQRAVDSGHPDESKGALTQLGALWATQGRIADAERAFIEVINSQHPEFAPTAEACLAELRRQTN